MRNMDMDNNIPCRKNMSQNKWSFSGSQSMGNEKKYLSGYSRSAALGGRDQHIFGNNLLPILQAADKGFPYFAERQACLYINVIMAHYICTAPLWVCSLSCMHLSWSGYRLTQESAVFQNDKLLRLVNRMWQCCLLGLVMMELLNELFNEQHHHIQLNQPGTPAITEHSNDLPHCILTKQSTFRD